MNTEDKSMHTDDIESVGMFKSETEILDFQGRCEQQ